MELQRLDQRIADLEKSGDVLDIGIANTYKLYKKMLVEVGNQFNKAMNCDDPEKKQLYQDLYWLMNTKVKVDLDIEQVQLKLKKLP